MTDGFISKLTDPSESPTPVSVVYRLAKKSATTISIASTSFDTIGVVFELADTSHADAVRFTIQSTS